MIYLILPIKNGWIFYGKLLNFQRVHVVQPHPEIPRGVPFVIWSVGRSTKDPLLYTLGYALRCVWGCLQTHTRLGVIREVQNISGVMGNMYIYIWWLYMIIYEYNDLNGQWKIDIFWIVDRSGKSWAFYRGWNQQCLFGKSSGTIPSDIDLFPNQAKERTHGSDQVDIL